jgi:hypothetical protein
MAKMVTFFIFCFIGTCIMGSIMAGGGGMSSTVLAANVTDSDDSLSVNSTVGFLGMGSIVIDSERIAYSDTDATHFKDTMLSPMARGTAGTTAAAHSVGAVVYTVESGKINGAMNYSIASITDASGLWIAITLPLALLRMLGQFLVLPISFLGTDLQIITYIWAAMGIGALVSIGLALAGSRRV